MGNLVINFVIFCVGYLEFLFFGVVISSRFFVVLFDVFFDLSGKVFSVVLLEFFEVSRVFGFLGVFDGLVYCWL